MIVCHSLSLPHLDARIQESVAQVGDDAGEQADQGVEHGRTDEQVVVKRRQGFERQIADARDREDSFQNHGAAHDAQEGADDHGKDGDHGVLQGALEEVLCRGIVQQLLQKKTSVPSAIFVSAVLFTIPHLSSMDFGNPAIASASTVTSADLNSIEAQNIAYGILFGN